MKSYVSHNAKYYKATRIKRIQKHNSREDLPDYLLSEQAKKLHLNYQNEFENGDFVFGGFESVQEAFDSSYTRQKKHKYANGNSIMESILAFSEEEALKVLREENGVEKLLKAGQIFAKKMKEEYGFEPLAVQLHSDEGWIKKEPPHDIHHNIHLHVTFHNYNHDKQKTVLRGMRKKDWIRTQDIAQESCEEIGLKFERGESKEKTNREHLEREDWIIVKEMQERIKELEDKLNDKEQDLRERISQINTQKKLNSKLLNNREQIKRENKKLTQEKRKYQSEIKQLKADRKGAAGKIEKITSKILENSKNGVFGGIDKDTLEELIKKELNRAYKTHLLSKSEEENRELKKVLRGADFAIDTIEEQSKIIQEQNKKIKIYEKDKINFESALNDRDRENRKLSELLKSKESRIKEKDKKIEKYENILGKNNIDTRNIGD